MNFPFSSPFILLNCIICDYYYLTFVCNLCVSLATRFAILRGDYTTRFGNSILYYNFLMNSLKFIKVYIIRKGISQGRQWWYYFFTKNQHFWENHKKHVFCHFSFKTGYKKIEILKIALKLFYWLKTSI